MKYTEWSKKIEGLRFNNLNEWDEERCHCFFSRVMTEEHANIIKTSGLPAKILRSHIEIIIKFHTSDVKPRKRMGRIHNQTRNTISLTAWNVKKKAKEGYYTVPFDNASLSNIKSKELILHPLLIFITQSGTYYTRHNHERGVEKSGITYFQSHKCSRIRAKAKEGFYGHGLDNILLSISTEELINHPIFKITKSITKNRKDAIVKEIMGVE